MSKLRRMRGFGVVVWAVSAAGAVTLEKDVDVRIGMRDGVILAGNVFRQAGTARLPAILIRTPYNKNGEGANSYQAFAQFGYAVVLEDVRGRYHSGGHFGLMGQEAADGDDTLNWIAHQPWSNGKIGMIGGSYLGIMQWEVAPLNNSHLRAIFPVVSGDDEYFDRYYSRGGAVKLGHRLLWFSQNMLLPGTRRPDFNKYVYHLPLRTSDFAATGQTLSFFQTALDHPSYDAYWKKISTREKLNRVRVPVFAVGGWYDNYAQGALEAFTEIGKHSSAHRIMIGPWTHNMSSSFPDVDFGKDAAAPIRKLQLQWFDYWLKSASPVSLSGPPVRIFVMGTNRWRDEPAWPIGRARETLFYLGSGGHARSLSGDGRLRQRAPRKEPADRFVYDPRNPVPTHGGAVCCDAKIFPWGPMDQRLVEKRQDVLVFTSGRLKQELEVTGPVRVMLYASTSAPDTDFTAKLVDVYPDGRAINLTDGILRVRYRNSLQNAELAHPGEVYPLSIDAGVTSNVFLRGHRIRLEVSSSNFPRFDRNPNTGRTIADETQLSAATQMVHHDARFPSALILPVVPVESEDVALRSGVKAGPKKAMSFKAR